MADWETPSAVDILKDINEAKETILVRKPMTNHPVTISKKLFDSLKKQSLEAGYADNWAGFEHYIAKSINDMDPKKVLDLQLKALGFQ